MSYWEVLARAKERLEQGDLQGAEDGYREASASRGKSPGRVFWTETVGDAARRFWRGFGGRDEAGEAAHWQHETEQFRGHYRDAARAALERARGTLADAAGCGARERLDVFGLAVFLASASRLADQPSLDPHPYCAAALDAALELGEMPPAGVVPVGTPLAAGARLDLVRRGARLLDRRTTPAAGDERARALAADLLSLLSADHFTTSAQETERCWYCALLTDRHLGSPREAVPLFLAYLESGDTTAPCRDEARLRAAEILGNVGGICLSVPRYAEAKRLLAMGGMLSPENEARRLAILDVIGGRALAGSGAWATMAHADGTWQCLLWQGEQPRDVVSWTPGDDPAPLQEHLRICSGRVVRRGAPCNILVSEEIDGFVNVFLESESYPDAVSDKALAALARSYGPGHGRPAQNPPPHPDLDLELLIPGSGIDRALIYGQVWLGVLHHILAADPALRCGIRELSRRGDRPATFLASFMPPELMPGSGLTATRLLDRANPHFPGPAQAAPPDFVLDPSLVEHDVAVVSTGRPGEVLRRWGADRHHWRLVLDGMDRWDDLASCLARRGGRHTLIPPRDEVHDRDAALSRLTALLGPQGSDAHELLPLFHWCRITETHNGDLMDFRRFRPWAPGVVPLYDEYHDLAEALPRTPLGPDGTGWAREYVERAAGSEVVVGTVDDLVVPDAMRRLAWGDDGDREAAWVFCDSPAVHWRLLTDHGEDIRAFHRGLAGTGRSHLSLVLGGGFLRGDLETLLVDWLSPYGRAVCLALSDQRFPHLRLAGGGTTPDARVEVGRAAIGLMQRLAHLTDVGRRVHLLPGREGPVRSFLAAYQRGELGSVAATALLWEDPTDFWRPDATRGRLRDGYLVVVRLESLDIEPAQDVAAVPHRGWRERDAAVSLRIRQRRAVCALEVCALMSRGAAEVDVADPRWWRSFPLDSATAVAPFPVPPVEAARLASGGRAEVYDLPEPDLAPGRPGKRWAPRPERSDPTLKAAVEWLRIQGWIDENMLGLPAGVLAVADGGLPAGWRERGRRLVIGDPGAAWLATLRRVTGARERGELDAWLLVIAGTPPPEATALRDAILSPGACLPVHGEDLGTWHAVVWATPEELADPTLRRRLTATPPRETWATDLRNWLPSAVSAGSEHATVLRFVLNELRSPATLHAGNLPRAWRDYFRALLTDAGDGSYLDRASSTVASLLDLPPVPVGRLGHPTCACPGCGVESSWRGWRQPCPVCGVSLDRWLQPTARRQLVFDIWRRKVAALRDREDLRQGRPLCVWVAAEHVDRLKCLLGEARLPWRRQRDRYLTTRDAEAPDWLICVHGELSAPPPECHHALLEPPANEEDLQECRRQTGGAVSLWFHPLELAADMGGLASAAGVSSGSSRMLLVTRFSAPPGLDPAWRWRGWLSPRLVEILTGMPITEVRKILGVTSWLQAVYNEPTATSGARETSDETGPRLLCRDLSSMEAEYKLMRLHPLLDSILPVLMASLRPGVVGHLQLDDLPLEVDDVELAWLDRFLLGESLTLPAGTEDAADAGDHLDNLLYASTRGVINGPQRRFGYVGNLEDVIANLHCQLDFLTGAFRALFAPGVGGEAPGTVRLADQASMILGEEALETGVLLGLWHVRGPCEPGEVAADPSSGPLREGSAVFAAAITLLGSLTREEDAWRQRLLEAWRTGFVTELPALPVPTHRELPVDAALAHAVIASDLVEAVGAGGPELLVLEGLSGTGRLPTIAQALALASADRADSADMTVFCPDTATAVRYNLAWRRCGIHARSPRIRFGTDLAVGSSLAGDTIPHNPAGEVAVLLEAHLMGAAERFRLAQRFRLGVQIWTVEPVLATESWEHLFLTPPEAEAVRRMTAQKRQSRRVCEEVLDMAEQATRRRPRLQPSRQARGEVCAMLTASLDDGMTLMCEKQAEWGGLLWHAVAPVPADLEYLGRAAARMGWLPVYRWELDELLLPGTLEFVAAARDAVACLAGDDTGDSGAGVAHAAALLPRSDVAEYRVWLEGLRDETGLTVGGFHDRVSRSGWSESFLACSANRARAARLASDFADVDLVEFLARPLLEAWRRVVGELPDQPSAGRGSPVLMLSTPDEGEGAPAGSLAYFCLGTEPPLHHYQVLQRATDRLLVLYKDRSPLTDGS
ncbi:hypothetical protein KKA85_11380 [bacterium]|nr:hypothetical protein [bacterium]